MKRIIAVINQKGGVGKTTTSINLACGFALLGKRVLLIDLDPQGHTTIGLGMREECKNTIRDVLLNGNRKELREAIYPTKIKNLDLVGANIHLNHASTLLIGQHFRETRLQQALEPQLDNYDYILIDCHPGLGVLEINAIIACNFLLVPTDTSRYSLEGFADLIDVIKDLKGKQNNIEDYLRILITIVDSREKDINNWTDEQLEAFEEVVLKTRIRKITKIKQAQIAEVPIMYFDQNSPGSKDYVSLAQELLSLWKDM